MDDLKELRDVITAYIGKGIAPELICNTVHEMLKGQTKDEEENHKAHEDEDREWAEKAFGTKFAN